MYKIWAKSNNPRLSYWRLSTFSRAILGGGSELTELFQGCVYLTSPNLARIYKAIIKALHFCFRIRISCCVFKRGRVKFEWCFKRRQILHFLTPCENKGRGGRDLYTNYWSFTYDRTSEIHLVATHCSAAERGVLIKIKKEKKVHG